MKTEKSKQISLPSPEKVTQIKREYPTEEQKYDDKNVSDRCRKIAEQFSLADHPDFRHYSTLQPGHFTNLRKDRAGLVCIYKVFHKDISEGAAYQ